MVPLKHAAYVSVSNIDKKSVEGELPVQVVNYTDVYYGDRLGPSQELKRATATPRQVEQFRLRVGDVLITKDSETPEDIGVPAYVESTAADLVLGYHLSLIRPRPGTYGRYLYWAICSESVNQQFETSATGVTRFGLRAEAIANTELPVPPLAEQRAIADYLDAETARIDALITKKQQLMHLLEERRKSVAASEVAGAHHAKQRKSQVPWVRSLPESWGEASLKLVARLGSGHTPSRNRPEWWLPEECEIPWVTTGEVSQMRSDRLEYLESTRERISAIGMANSSACFHPRDSVVLCRTAASAGYSAIMATAMATSQDIVVWTCGPLLRPRYLLLCLRVMRSDLLGRLAMGSTHKTIYMPDVESIRVPLPRVEEQDEIVGRVWRDWGAIDAAVGLLTDQVGRFAERRQALISTAVTGEFGMTRAL